MKRIELIIYGKVQGVFFRDSAKKKADELNLTGWVRNESDSTVKIVAEGKEEDLKELVKWSQKGGPEGAMVMGVEVDWQEATGEFKNFKIK